MCACMRLLVCRDEESLDKAKRKKQIRPFIGPSRLLYDYDQPRALLGMIKDQVSCLIRSPHHRVKFSRNRVHV